MSDYDDYNESELTYMARMINPHATRGLGREFLIEIIESEEPIDIGRPPVDDARDDIFQMVDHFWKQVESLINCPMKSRAPRACFKCADVQVAECTVANVDLIQQVKAKEDPHER